MSAAVVVCVGVVLAAWLFFGAWLGCLVGRAIARGERIAAERQRELR